jgi:hypothetical protein
LPSDQIIVGQGDAKLDEEATCQLIDFVPTMLYKVPHELMELCMFTAAVMLFLPLFLLLLLHMSDAVKHSIPAMRSRQRVPTI